MGVAEPARVEDFAGLGNLRRHFHGVPFFPPPILRFPRYREVNFGRYALNTGGLGATPMPRQAGKITCHVGSERFLDQAESGITLEFPRCQVF